MQFSWRSIPQNRFHLGAGDDASEPHLRITSFEGTLDRVTGLALLPGNMLASVSADRTLRIWNLNIMEQVGAEAATSQIDDLD